MLNIEEIVISKTNATKITSKEVIQQLWSGYGEIIRFRLDCKEYPSVVVKLINLSNHDEHPRGWNTSVSHERKVQSYKNEVSWYKGIGSKLKSRLNLPGLLYAVEQGTETLLILEDASNFGFSSLKQEVTIKELKSCISWLTKLHSNTLNLKTVNLWSKGSYWHLSTRIDEYLKMVDSDIKNNAKLLDSLLNNTSFQCVIHGDAKLANFCFHEHKNEVLGLDFQYTGKGCGIKDLAYLIGSALSSDDCFKYEKELLDFYFKELENQLDNPIVFRNLEKEWRPLYSIAWADFNRFLLGWNPIHSQLNEYSKAITERAISQLKTI